MDKNTVLEAILFMESTLRADGTNVDKMILFGSHAGVFVICQDSKGIFEPFSDKPVSYCMSIIFFPERRFFS